MRNVIVVIGGANFEPPNILRGRGRSDCKSGEDSDGRAHHGRTLSESLGVMPALVPGIPVF